MNLIEYPDRDVMARDVAATLAADLAQALARQDRVTFVVPGGTTPGPLFDILCEADLEWARVHVLLSDERWVPESDANSNAALLRARLLTGRATAAAFTPYFTDQHPIAQAAKRASADLTQLMPIDVLVLGMGVDMHTASLFPASQGLAQALADDAPLLLPITIARQAVQRITLSAPALRGARATHLLVTGTDKRAAITRAQTLPAQDAPVNLVLDTATVHWSTA